MIKYQLNDLKKKNDAADFIRGTSKNGKIEKNGHFYHVISRSWNGETIFYPEIGQYRNRLLCKLCEERNITIIFSVAMPNHTHDVFLTEQWKDLSIVMRILNTHLSHYIRERSKKNYQPNWKIFDPNILYIAIRNISSLFYVGKYIHDNPSGLVESNRKIPFTCFWLIRNGHLPSVGYDKALYEKLFNMTAEEVCDFYETHTKQEVSNYSMLIEKEWSSMEMSKLFTAD